MSPHLLRSSPARARPENSVLTSPSRKRVASPAGQPVRDTFPSLASAVARTTSPSPWGQGWAPWHYRASQQGACDGQARGQLAQDTGPDAGSKPGLTVAVKAFLDEVSVWVCRFRGKPPACGGGSIRSVEGLTGTDWVPAEGAELRGPQTSGSHCFRSLGAPVCAYMHACAHTCPRTHTRTCAHTAACTYMCAHMYMLSHTHMCTLTHASNTTSYCSCSSEGPWPDREGQCSPHGMLSTASSPCRPALPACRGPGTSLGSREARAG